MKHILILLIAILPAFTDAHSKVARAYMPSVGDYVKPKPWSQYPFTYAAWTDPTGNPNPYHTYFGWGNKRCQVTGLWVANNQWYVQLNIPGTDYYVTWPVNYINPNTQAATDLLTPTF
jgi:hypothetical protein